MSNFTPLKAKNKKKANKTLIIANIFLVFVLVLVSSILVINNKTGQKPKAAGGWCNAPDAGKDFGSPCTTKDKVECGGDGVEAKCLDSTWTWHATGNCCNQPTLPPPPGGGAKCPNDPNTPIASYIKFTCPNGCFKDNDGTWRCTLNRESSTNPLTLNGAFAQVDALSGAADNTFCGTTEYTCGKPECQPGSSNPTSTPIPSDLTSTPIPSETPIPTSTPIPTTPPGQPTNTPVPTATNTPTPTRTPTPTPTTPPGQPTNTPAPTATNAPGPTLTPIPVLCGTKSCDNATNPCRSGYSCVQAKDGSNYCTSPDFADACKANPSYNTCCTAPGAPTATPTEIILAKTSISPTVAKLLQTGMVKSFMYFIPAVIILLGLLL